MPPQTGKTEGHGTNCFRAILSGRSREITLRALRGRDGPSWIPLPWAAPGWVGACLQPPGVPRLGWAAGSAGIKGS